MAGHHYLCYEKVSPSLPVFDVINYNSSYNLEISGGLGPTANKVLRVGLMGYNATACKVDQVLEVLKEALEAARSTKNSKL